MNDKALDRLLADLRDYQMTPEEREEQRRSFAFGNAKLANPRITRELVDEIADKE